jgi:hypothetical protein
MVHGNEELDARLCGGALRCRGEIGVVISITFDGHDARINVLKVGRACVRNDKHL